MERRGRPEPFRLLLLCWLSAGSTQLRHPLPVLWMMPVSSGPGGDNLTAAVAPAVRLALRDLQRQPPPLGNYEVQLQLLDSQCDPAKSLKALFDAMWAGPRYLLVFGGVCPPVTALIARSLPALNLVQVSFAASSPSLSNRKWYGNLFSTMPSDRAVNQATVKLLQRYKWTRVGIVTQEGPRLSEMKKDLMRQLLKANVQLVSTQSLSEDVCSSLRRLKESDVRIIIGHFEEDSASEVFCCAYRLNLFGPRYQWLVVDGGAAGWRLERPVSGCTADSLLTAADGSIRLQIRQISRTNAAGVSGRTPQDYQDSYLKQLTQQGSKFSPIHSFAYDAVWVAARALSQVMEAVKHREKFSSQKNTSVSEEEVYKTLLEAVKRTQFDGVTGPVFFRNGERMTTIELIQFQGSSGVLVGEFSTSTQQLRLMNQLLKFKGPGPARDRILVLLQRQHVGLLLYITVSSAAAVTIIITLTVLFLTVLSRRQRSVRRLLRSSGGSQDELLLLGILLSSSSVLISGLDEASLSNWTFELFCSVRLWTLSVGHTVGFAVLFTKTWRVYSLHTLKPKQRAACLLLGMFLLDVFVLTSWQILDPLRRVVLQHNLQRDVDQDVLIRPYSERCSSTNMELWLTAVYGYKAPLLGLGCFVAWNIRTVQVDHPAGKHLTLSMFAVTAFSAAGVSGSLLTSQSPALHFCLSSATILCCNVFILSCLFGPKFLYVWMNGGELQGEAAEEEEEEQLRSLNQQLKSQIAQLDAEIENISMQISEETKPAAPDSKLQHTTEERSNAGEVGSVMWTHAQVCSDDRNSEMKPSSPDSINSPELVWRRLSVQLPILHHSYLPAVGGVSASSCSLFGRQEVFIHQDLLTTEPRYC